MHPRVRRFIFFILMIVVGLAAGLGYGWAINPRQNTNASPETLRVDYKTDVVLMIAEIYQSEQDIPIALQRLAFLGSESPGKIISTAVDYAQSHNYASTDLQIMYDLQSAVDTATQNSE